MKTCACLLLLTLGSAIAFAQGGDANSPAPRIMTVYDSVKDRTTIKLAPVRVSGEKGKYQSLYMSLSFSYAGHLRTAPDFVDFELQTVVKGRLDSALYVVFRIDGETVFLSSNRWAVKRPVPGRVWVGERLVFRMPYETFVKVARAKTFAIKFAEVEFAVGEEQRQSLRELLMFMRPETNAG
ncbi:MAG: hypothetical protein QOJ88_518 [Pyrinomonadaceae bacterium]|jgi:hypothetical protein|nr:hypothetical protein [Pyrinomonadaceae bacterium]